MEKNKSSELLGVDIEEKEEEIVPEVKVEKKEEKIVDGENEFLEIKNLQEVIEIVEKENKEKETNPSAILDGELGINFIEGKPHLVIDNEYVPHDEAMIILQTRKVVREWLKLDKLKKGIKE